jgi:hypothetical protein
MKFYQILFFLGLGFPSINIQANNNPPPMNPARCVTANSVREKLPEYFLSAEEAAACVVDTEDGNEKCVQKVKRRASTWDGIWNIDLNRQNEISKRCCPGLIPDIENKICKEKTGEGNEFDPAKDYTAADPKDIGPSAWDNQLKTCSTSPTNPIACEDPTKGCFYLDGDDDLFSNEDPASKESRERLDDQLEKIGLRQEAIFGESDAEPSIGDDNYICSKNNECESYYCHQGYCRPDVQQVCRLAAEDEYAPGPILCEEPFKENNQQICRSLDPIPLYLSDFYKKIPINVSINNKCSMESMSTEGQNERESLAIGIAFLRAFEWMYETSEIKQCLEQYTHFQNVVSHHLTKPRVKALTNFTLRWDQVMKDFKKLATATQAGAADFELTSGKKTVNTISFESIVNTRRNTNQFTNQEISGLTSSGIMLYSLLKNRAHAMYDYETDMKGVVNTFLVDMNSLDNYFGGLQSDLNAKTWNFGIWNGTAYVEKSYGKADIFCRNRKRMKRAKRFRTRAKLPVKDATRNEMIMSKDVLQFSRLVDYSDEKSYFKNLLEKKRLFLIDPLMGGNLGPGYPSHGFESYGSGGDSRRGYDTFWNKVSDNLGTFGVGLAFGPVGLFVANLFAQNTSEVMKMKSFMMKSIPPFLKNKLPPNVPVEHSFAEPELGVSTVCLNEVVDAWSSDPVKPVSKDCQRAQERLVRMGEVSFATSIIYSMHTHRRFRRGYFNTADIKSRKGKMAINKFMIDVLEKFSDYYTAMAEIHKKQMECYDALINKAQNEIITADDKGIQIGFSDYGVTPPNNGGSSDRVDATGKNKNSGVKSVDMKYYVSASKPFLTKYDSLTKSEATTANSIFNSAVLGENTKLASAIMKKNKAQRDAYALNNPAKATEIQVITNSLTSSLGGSIFSNAEIGTGVGAGSGAIYGSNSGSGANSSSGSAGSSSSNDKSSQTASLSGANVKKDSFGDDERSRFGSGFGMDGGMSGGMSGGMNYYKSTKEGGYFSSSDGSGNGMTGLSKEQEKNMLNEIEKSKSDLAPTGEDSLFQVVSKGYQRNLHRVLKKKSDPGGINNKKSKNFDQDKEELKKSILGL